MESNVDFVAVDMPTADRFMLHVYAAMAEEEGWRISQRTKAALAVAKARGVVLGANGKTLARKNKRDALIFRRTYATYLLYKSKLEGHATIRAIVKELNLRRIPSREGGRWHISSVNKLS